MSNNAMFSIKVYRHPNIKTTWVFDDDTVGLKAEPFVLGASELIDYHLKLKNIKSRKPVLTFSQVEVPNADIILTRTKAYGILPGDGTSDDFRSGDFIDQYGNKCWLCPAQLLYFKQVPEKIWAFVK